MSSKILSDFKKSCSKQIQLLPPLGIARILANYPWEISDENDRKFQA